MNAVSNVTFALLAVAGVIIFTASGLPAHAGARLFRIRAAAARGRGAEDQPLHFQVG